jgi:hypothetical protein
LNISAGVDTHTHIDLDLDHVRAPDISVVSSMLGAEPFRTLFRLHPSLFCSNAWTI